MTERKPPNVGFESWVDRQIREAAERGEFDNLPGAGKPIPGLADPDDELWWVKGYIRREGLSTEAMLPTPLRLRKEIERLPHTVRRLRSESAVRAAVADLNRRITEWLRVPVGPQVHLAPVDADEVTRQWRLAREPTEAGAVADDRDATTGPPITGPPITGPATEAASPEHPRRTRWWRWRARRGRR